MQRRGCLGGQVLSVAITINRGQLDEDARIFKVAEIPGLKIAMAETVALTTKFRVASLTEVFVATVEA